MIFFFLFKTCDTRYSVAFAIITHTRSTDRRKTLRKQRKGKKTTKTTHTRPDITTCSFIRFAKNKFKKITHSSTSYFFNSLAACVVKTIFGMKAVWIIKFLLRVACNFTICIGRKIIGFSHRQRIKMIDSRRRNKKKITCFEFL